MFASTPHSNTGRNGGRRRTGRSGDRDGPPFRLSKTPGRLRSPAPCLGEHTHQVAKEILGLSDDEIAELTVEQVLY